MSRTRRRILIILGIFLLLLIGMFLTITDGLNEAVSVVVKPVDLSGVPDGSYTGTYTYKRWSNTVQVVVIDHRIVEIAVLKDVGAGEVTNCADEIIDRVLDAQSTQVDAVSGATATSKAYLKAIEDALS